MPKPTLTDEELRQLGKSWFTEARQTSEQDAVELREWNKQRRKSTADGASGGFFSGDADSGGCDGGGGD